MDTWYSYRGEATWGEHEAQGKRTADRVVVWRVIARGVDEACERARAAVCGLDDPPPDRLRVLEAFELDPEAAEVRRASSAGGAR